MGTGVGCFVSLVITWPGFRGGYGYLHGEYYEASDYGYLHGQFYEPSDSVARLPWRFEVLTWVGGGEGLWAL